MSKEDKQALIFWFVLLSPCLLVTLWSDLLFYSPFTTLSDLILSDNYQREHNFKLNSWSPDSRYLIFEDEMIIKIKAGDVGYPWAGSVHEREYYVFDTQNHKTWQLNSRYDSANSDYYTDTYLYAVRWSSDSQRILYHYNGGLYLLRIETPSSLDNISPPEQLGYFALDWRSSPMWSPDGNEMAFAERGRGTSYEFRTLDVKTREIREEKPEWWTDEAEPVSDVSPNGRYTAKTESNKISVFDTEMDAHILDLSETETYQYPLIHANFYQSLLLMGIFSFAGFAVIYKGIKFGYFPFILKGGIVWVFYLICMICACGWCNWLWVVDLN